MTAYILRRLLYSIPLVIGVSLLVFLIFDSGVFGDPVVSMVGKMATPEQIAELREDYGYDKPWPERFWTGLVDTVTFDFGRSRQHKTDILEMIVRGAGPSLTVTLPGYLIATVLAVSLALFCAAFRGGMVDRTLLVVAVAMMSVSSVVYIIFGQYVVSHRLRLAPVGGYEYGPGAVAFVWLPVLIFVLLSVAPDLRFYRTSLLEEIKQDYVRTARSKGVNERKVLFVHVLRNGLIPILTNVIVVLPFLFTGTLLLERFFSIPGIGFMIVDGVTNADLPVVRALTFMFALIFVVSNLLTDVLYSIVDPRVRLS